MLLWLKIIHLLFIICWFAGLFYLPRLFVYHVATSDEIGNQRFIVMEYKLFHYIMSPSAILTLISGGSLWWLHGDTAQWLIIKLVLVLCLLFYHLYCGYIVRCFSACKNTHSARFFRIYNEIPVVLLIAILYLAVFRPL